MLKNPNYVYGSKIALLPANLNLGEYILDKIWTFRDNVFMINATTDEKTTYGDVVQLAMNLAVSLTRMGVRKGQTVAICSENRTEFFPTVIGAICTGAVVTAINIGYTKDELKHVMDIAKPRYIFCSPMTYKIHEKSLKSLSYLKKIIVFGNERVAGALYYNDFVVPNVSSDLKSNVKYEEFVAADVTGQTDTVFILYSSGTTGLPKGVMLTHLNVISSCCLPTAYDVSKITVTIVPWFHVMGLVGQMTAMVTGRTCVYLPKFDIDLYLRTIHKYGAEQLSVVPPVLVALSKVKTDYDVSSVRLVYSGAAPLYKDTLDALKAIFPHAKVLQGYGMTEVTLAVTRDADPALAKPGGVGYVIGGSVIKVVDIETRKVLGPNQRGEICIKGPLLMKGYYGKDATEEYDEEGFFKTGDIGYYDDDRYFFIVDRLKELIKYKGYQVPPAEIEALLMKHEAVKDAGVVGVPHKSAGEVPLAFVVAQPGCDVTEDEIRAFVADRLSNPKHLRGGVRFVEEIPKNPSGKILRKHLRIMAKTGKSKL